MNEFFLAWILQRLSQAHDGFHQGDDYYRDDYYRHVDDHRDGNHYDSECDNRLNENGG